jgi:hypothetical protein
MVKKGYLPFLQAFREEIKGWIKLLNCIVKKG